MAALKINEFYVEKATRKIIYVEGPAPENPDIIYFLRYSDNLENCNRYMQHTTKLNDHNYDPWPRSDAKKILLLKMIK